MAPPSRVLLVDDDPDFCEALGDRLRSLGFQVSVADRGQEALRLENVIERAAVLADGPEVTARDLPAEIQDAALADGVRRESARTYHAAVEEFKRGLIASTLRRTNGNRPRAARLLGLQRTYLARLIRDLGLAAPAAGAPVPAGAGNGVPLPARAAAE